MPEFAYEALTEGGSVTRGEMLAESEPDLETKLRQQGQFLIRAEPLVDAAWTPAGSGEARDDSPPRRGGRTDGSVKRKELLAFTEYLWGSAQAGIPILTTLDDLEVQLESKRMRQITAELRESMTEDGKSLSEAMAEHPKAFPGLYVGTIEAGETTGQLDYALKQLVDYLEWQQEITLQIRQATLYPIIVLLVMLGLVVLLVVYVYPRLLPIFTGFGVDLPLPTRIVMTSGDFLRTRWSWLVGGAGAVFLLTHLIGRTTGGRMAIDTMKLKVPIFGSLIHQLQMARVVTYMGLFYRTGIDLLRGFSLLEQVITNARVRAAVREARESISSGSSIAAALAATGLFPQVVIRSFALGEATGKLDESLERARIYYAREVPAAVRRMLSALQPLLVVVLGALLGMIAMSIFLPIVSIYQSVGR